MRRFFPDKFGWRERLLSLLAVVMAIVSCWLTLAAGLGAGVAWLIFIGFGTVVLVAIAGSDRCFFTTIFTSSFAVLLIADILKGVFVDHMPLGLGDAVTFLLIFAASVLLPAAFAWLVTKIARYARRVGVSPKD